GMIASFGDFDVSEMPGCEPEPGSRIIGDILGAGSDVEQWRKCRIRSDKCVTRLRSELLRGKLRDVLIQGRQLALDGFRFWILGLGIWTLDFIAPSFQRLTNNIGHATDLIDSHERIDLRQELGQFIAKTL